jgi:SAM-dependent methyltransferase
MMKWRRTGPLETAYPDWVAYEPALVPPPRLMGEEGITVLEEWFRWGEEWSLLLRLHGAVDRAHHVLEIGCGLGRIAFPLRYILTADRQYTGFEVVRRKIDFLTEHFTPAHPNFRFVWADVVNSYYNPAGRTSPTEYRFPAADASVDLVFAASVFTHMSPENTAHYIRESARVLRPGGRCVFSFFLVDQITPGVVRPGPFHRADFDFAHRMAGWGDEFRYVRPENPEQMTAYRTSLVARFAAEAGLAMSPPVPGRWSGTAANSVTVQDLLVLTRPT